jgi:hypothetical protein
VISNILKAEAMGWLTGILLGYAGFLIVGYWLRQRAHGKRHSLRVHTGLPPGIAIEPHTSGFGPFLSEDEQERRRPVPTRDPVFDAEFRVWGVSEAETLSLLGADVRQTLRGALRKGYLIQNGDLVRIASEGSDDGKRLAEMKGLAQKLHPGLDSLPKRLAANVESETVSAVRSRNLEVLLTRFPLHEVAKEKASSFANDTDVTVRLLCGSVLTERQPEILSAGLEDVLQDDRLESRHLPLAKKLAEIAPQAPILKRIQPWLLECLTLTDWDDIVQAIFTLGVVGDSKVAGAISQLKQSHGFEVRAAIRSALAQIASREGAIKGRLSPLETDSLSGALSESDSTGQVSVVESFADEAQRD